MNLKPAAALSLLAVAALVPATAGAESPTRIDPEAKAKLDRAEQRWKDSGIRTYSYKIRRICFCPPEYTRKVTITVRNGKPRNTPRNYRGVNKVEKLFDLIRGGLDAEHLEARYRSATGVPRSIYIDRSFMIADEEIGYEITRFRAPKG